MNVLRFHDDNARLTDLFKSQVIRPNDARMVLRLLGWGEDIYLQDEAHIRTGTGDMCLGTYGHGSSKLLWFKGDKLYVTNAWRITTTVVELNDLIYEPTWPINFVRCRKLQHNGDYSYSFNYLSSDQLAELNHAELLIYVQQEQDWRHGDDMEAKEKLFEQAKAFADWAEARAPEVNKYFYSHDWHTCDGIDYNCGRCDVKPYHWLAQQKCCDGDW